jgi:hypothetical protein
MGMAIDDTKQGMPVVINKLKLNPVVAPKPLKPKGRKPITPDKKSGTQ